MYHDPLALDAAHSAFIAQWERLSERDREFQTALAKIFNDGWNGQLNIRYAAILTPQEEADRVLRDYSDKTLFNLEKSGRAMQTYLVATNGEKNRARIDALEALKQIGGATERMSRWAKKDYVVNYLKGGNRELISHCMQVADLMSRQFSAASGPEIPTHRISNPSLHAYFGRLGEAEVPATSAAPTEAALTHT